MSSDTWDRRATGRTTRMLEEVTLAAKHNNYIFVVCANADERPRLGAQLIDIARDRGFVAGFAANNKSTVKVELMPVEADARCEVSIETTADFDWRRWKFPGAYPAIPYFVDHYAIRHQWGHILERFHKYDAALAAQDGREKGE